MSEKKTEHTESNEIVLRDAWMKEARAMTMENLPAFLDRLVNHGHDYGTICRAIAAAGVAAAWAVERSPQGRITGFQAGCVLWDLIAGWDSSYESKPLRITDYSHMLYPQYSDNFKTIGQDTWEYLQKEAKERLGNGSVNEDVTKHWQSIIDGNVPFGYTITKE